MAPSILSSLYTTVLPNYFEGIKSYPPEEALDSALALVNNVSKKRLLSHIEEMILRLDQMELAEPDSLKDNPFAKQLMEETRLSASKIEAFKGICIEYLLSILYMVSYLVSILFLHVYEYVKETGAGIRKDSRARFLKLLFAILLHITVSCSYRLHFVPDRILRHFWNYWHSSTRLLNFSLMCLYLCDS